MHNNASVYQVSEINSYIKGLLTEDHFLRDLRVSGEISNYTHHRSGHIYFRIKDSKSTLRCVFFRRDNFNLLFKPENGMEVIIRGYISLYEPDGAYQFYVQEMEPAGMGSLFLAFEQLKRRLAEEGLFREEHKQVIPLLPRKIALVTSPTGAALQDMLSTISKRFPHVHLLVVESLVQGPEAAADLVHAIETINRRDDVDLIILARGGGSLEDLWPFNEEPLARAIFSSRIPIISAVGHETDYTIADFVADLRAPTPTAAAVAALPAGEELLLTLQRLDERLARALQSRFLQEKQRLDHIVGERFYRRPAERIALSAVQLKQLSDQLKKETIRLLELKGLKLSALIDKMESYSPLQIMSRGFSYCRDEEGKIIRSVRDIHLGQLLQLKFRDGRADCRTERIEEDWIVES